MEIVTACLECGWYAPNHGTGCPKSIPEPTITIPKSRYKELLDLEEKVNRMIAK